ncbi:MAG: radical SAM protein, partial [Microvirga sp.]
MAVEVVTFGCRLNTYESEAMQRHAEEAGLGEVVIVNTCAVTGEATRQARQSIRKLAREKPGARIIVTGCAAQVEPETFAAMPEVSQVVGNHEKMKAETWAGMRDFGAMLSEKVLVNDIMAVKETAVHLIDGMRGRTRAFVQVQNGCDHRCTFCIIPYGRGNSRSVPMGAVVEQVRTLVEHGSREVVLTGVDITSYGKDLPGEPKLGTMVKSLLRHVPELERLRISSIDSVEADDDLLDVIA